MLSRHLFRHAVSMFRPAHNMQLRQFTSMGRSVEAGWRYEEFYIATLSLKVAMIRFPEPWLVRKEF